MNTNENKIIGVGQAGIEVLERMQPSTVKNTDLVVCDIDIHTLSRSSVKNKIQLEAAQSKTLTSNFIIEIEKHCQLTTEVDLAMNATINAFDHIDSLFSNDSEMAVLIANLGDTSGAGIIPVIAQIAKKEDYLLLHLFILLLVCLGNPYKKQQITD